MIALVAVGVFVLTSAGIFAFRPPLIHGALNGMQQVLQSGMSKPIQLTRYFKSPRVSQARLIELELEVARLREAEDENYRLRGMLGYKAPRGLNAIPSRVLALDLDPIRGVAWVGAGAREGVQAGSPVVAEGGLVGVIDEVSGRRSRVQLLRSNRCPVSVRNTRTRVIGVVNWNPGKRELSLDYIPTQVEVAVGDSLYSSGLGGVLPADLPVGVISAVTESPDLLLKQIRVEPFASFFSLEEVFVLTHDPDWEEGVILGESSP
ncbi:MAG: rod shape-determining protein MreC [Candidatus Eisenbacteria bacterium]|uniref:Cell shape-determining protein MreC n=1 Tax=Eiseniibacteriota bacterium TaxID=2212470 RepID=A0A7Y2H2E1_UNCEI|nr:rod shape-determining protein MreC [Candidatus Eisenbacteria bacterium]